MRRLLPAFLAALALAVPAAAQAPRGPDAAERPAPLASLLAPPAEASPRGGVDELYYLTRPAPLFGSADETRPLGELRRSTPVTRLGSVPGWTRVRLDDGREGYVRGFPLSNVWVRVSKTTRRLDLFRGPDLVRSYRADFSVSPLSDKERRGSTADPDAWRTPEGTFTVARRLPNSQFYKAFVLNYPTPEHARRGLERGLISRAEHDAILEADRKGELPPQHTALGGMIEIHGAGSGQGLNWTQGCVALTNREMDELWPHLWEGTPVVIDP